MMDLDLWISQPPKYTTIRINKLKQFDSTHLTEFLRKQNEELKMSKVPNFYFLRPDCLVLDPWPEEVNHAQTENDVIVHSSCAAAVLRGAHVFAPGVMGLPANLKIGNKVNILGDLDGHCKRGLKVPYDGNKLYVGQGYLKMLRKDLFDNGVQPSGIAIHVLLPASRLPVINATLYPKGVILLQNLPSIICGWVVNAQPHEHILDMCAAPGNKTTHLAEMSNNQAIIIAIDKTEQKIGKIKENCDMHSVTCVKAYAYDSTRCWSDNAIGIEGGPPFPMASFDKVLLDAPCSALGQRPQLLNKMTPKMQQSYKFVQRKLIDAAVRVLKVGGKLVYSTCTTTLDENEELVVWALQKHPMLRLIPAEPLLGGPGLPDAGLNDEQRLMVQRFGPENDKLRMVEPIYRDTIGFFIAQFIKL